VAAGGVTAKFQMDATASANLSGSGTLVARFIREIPAAVQFSGAGSLTITKMIRERNYKVTLSGEGTIFAAASRYEVKQIAITSSFAPGDKIIIDCKKLRVTKNAQTIGYNGDFYDLRPGANQITYTDPAGSRTVLLRITHRDKYLY
jgi:hypothetical protein